MLISTAVNHPSCTTVKQFMYLRFKNKTIIVILPIVVLLFMINFKIKINNGM